METAPAPVVYKCDRCGCESTIKEAFLVKKKSAFQPGSTLCFECAIKKQSSPFVHTKIIWVLFAFAIGLTILADVQTGLVELAVVAGLLLFGYPLTVLHELSHILVARLLGLRVFSVHLGTGQMIYTTRRFGFRWYLHKNPIGGATFIAGPPMPFFNARQFFSGLAGPAFHAILIALMAWLLSTGKVQTPDWLYALVITLLLINGVFLLFSLIPTKAAVAIGIAGTDGYRMLQILRGKGLPEAFPAYYFLAAYDAIGVGDLAAARRWYDAGHVHYPDSPILLTMECFLLSREEEYARARELCLHQIESSQNLTELQKYTAYHNIAYYNLMLEDPSLLPQADEFSALSYKNMSWDPSVMSTRGQTLLALGKVEEGILMLKNALKRSWDHMNKAFTSALLAQAEFRRGRASEAEKYFRAAVKLDPHCVLIKKLKIEMGQAIPEKALS